MRRRTLSMVFAGLALCLGLGLISAGCAASGPLIPVEPGTPEHPLADSTLWYLTQCAEHWSDELKKSSYKLQFNVTINDLGGVSRVYLEGSGLNAPELERCMVGALRNMTVPPFVYERVASERTSQRVPAQARSLVGDTATMEQVFFTLSPVLIEAGPVVFIVVIGIVATAAMAESVNEKKERCNEERRNAKERCIDLLASRNPPRGLTGGHTDIENCMQGFISEDCRGNDIDWGPQGRPGRKY